MNRQERQPTPEEISSEAKRMFQTICGSLKLDSTTDDNFVEFNHINKTLRFSARRIVGYAWWYRKNKVLEWASLDISPILPQQGEYFEGTSKGVHVGFEKESGAPHVAFGTSKFIQQSGGRMGGADGIWELDSRIALDESAKMIQELLAVLPKPLKKPQS